MIIVRLIVIVKYMQKTTKTFIWGLVIGLIFGAILEGAWVLNLLN